MKLDFTQNVALDKKSLLRYQKARILLWAFALSAAIFLSYRILFPAAPFLYSYLNPNASSNTIINPRDSDGGILDHGRLGADRSFLFDTGLVGDYSDATVSLTFDNKSEVPADGSKLTVTARKGYQAFFYPEGVPVASQESLDLSDGQLLAYGISAYAASRGAIYPINNAVTFVAMGWNWDDLKTVSPDEIAAYEKGKLMTIASAHPSGTVFKTTENNQWYLIDNGAKRKLAPVAAEAYVKNRNPVLVDEKSLTATASCDLKRDFLSSHQYSCQIPISGIQSFLGKDYEFSLSGGTDLKIERVDVVFSKEASLKNLRGVISDMLGRVRANYSR